MGEELGKLKIRYLKSQIEIQSDTCFRRENRTEQQNGKFHAGMPDVRAFFHCGDAQVLDSCLLSGMRDRFDPVAVAIGLDREQHLQALRKVRPDLFDILRESGKINPRKRARHLTPFK
jgi:hypothetical protein